MKNVANGRTTHKRIRTYIQTCIPTYKWIYKGIEKNLEWVLKTDKHTNIQTYKTLYSLNYKIMEIVSRIEAVSCRQGICIFTNAYIYAYMQNDCNNAQKKETNQAWWEQKTCKKEFAKNSAQIKK